MALKDCVTQLMQAGKLSKEVAAEVTAFAKEHGGNLESEAVEFLQKRKLEQKRQAMIQTLKNADNIKLVKSHKDGTAAGVEALLARDPKGHAPYANVDYRQKTMEFQALGRMGTWLEKFRPRNLGFTQDAKSLQNVVQELWGRSTGNGDAAEFAKAFTDSAEWLRRKFIEAGGDIAKRQDWHMPQHHDTRAIVRAGLDKWKNDIKPLLDMNRMYTPSGQKITAPQLDAALNDIFAAHNSAGASRIIPGSDAKRKLANAWSDSRFLAFKDDESFLKYNAEYGEADLMKLMVGHIQGLANDTGTLQVLGPNPDFAARYFKDLAAVDGASKAQLNRIDRLYSVVSGKVNEGAGSVMAKSFAMVRNLLSAGLLPSAFISSFTDSITARHVAAFNGLNSTRMFGEMMSQLKPGNSADRAYAARLSVGADAYISGLLAASRYSEVSADKITSRISDFVYKATLLTPWTEAGRNAFGVEFLTTLGEQAGKKFDKLPAELQTAFSRYGIDPQKWEIIRQADAISKHGVKALDLQSIPAIPGVKPAEVEETMRRVNDMVLSEMDYAVVSPDARVKAITTMGLPQDSLVGQLVRSGMMFKSFPIASMTTHLMRGLSEQGFTGKAAYLGSLMVALTAMGAVSLQTKEIIKGKDPQDMTTAGFWGNAFLQGGGLGIYGDFLYSGINGADRYGSNLVTTALGPMARLANDVVNLTAGNLGQFLKDKDTNFGREMTKFLRFYTPDLWYTRTALDRILFDQLQEMVDPEANKAFGRIMRQNLKERGQEFWWNPGEVLPERAPNLGAAIGQ
jgi:hypothetical protein